MAVEQGCRAPGHWCWWCWGGACALPAPAPLAYTQALAQAVESYNQRPDVQNAFRLLSADPEPAPGLELTTLRALNFSIMETECSPSSRVNPEDCDFKENGDNSSPQWRVGGRILGHPWGDGCAVLQGWWEQGPGVGNRVRGSWVWALGCGVPTAWSCVWGPGCSVQGVGSPVGCRVWSILMTPLSLRQPVLVQRGRFGRFLGKIRHFRPRIKFYAKAGVSVRVG
uniref:CTHL1 protein n=1 Tax=Amazona collaria TaxID=241587 RepID=A0A8B9EZX2_9PSIT